MLLALYDSPRSEYRNASMWLIQVKYPDGWMTLETTTSEFGADELWRSTKKTSFGRYRLRLVHDCKVVKYNK